VLTFFAKVNSFVNVRKISFEMSVITGTATKVGSQGSLMVI
jgi:hypothetical protein